MLHAYQRRHITVDEYEWMGRTGIIGPDERTELLDGEIVRMPPIGKRHASVVDRLTELFVLRFNGRARVRVQGPINLSELSQPQPDLLLLRYDDRYFAGGHPTPRDAFLTIEVGDSTRVADREIKEPLYARAAVPEAWFIDVVAAEMRVCRHPARGAYGEALSLRPGDEVACLAFPEEPFAVAGLLGTTAAD